MSGDNWWLGALGQNGLKLLKLWMGGRAPATSCCLLGGWTRTDLKGDYNSLGDYGDFGDYGDDYGGDYDDYTTTTAATTTTTLADDYDGVCA